MDKAIIIKKIVLTTVIILLPLLGFSQSIFDKYEENEDVAFVSVSPRMFRMLGSLGIETDDPEANAFMELVNNIKSFKVITTENNNITSDITNWVDSHLKKSSLDELMRVREGNSNIKIFVQSGKDENHVKELLMLVTGMKDIDLNGKKFETILLSLTGDIDLRKIGDLTEKMDLPGGEQLKKAGRNR